MAKGMLAEPFHTLEHQIIDTLLAGHKQWRPDLEYPQSHSDMQAAVRALLTMYSVERRPIPMMIPLHQSEGADEKGKPLYYETGVVTNGRAAR